MCFFCFYRFIQDSPTLSEFESQIIFYRNLELQINGEPEYIVVGALALFTGNNHNDFLKKKQKNRYDSLTARI